MKKLKRKNRQSYDDYDEAYRDNVPPRDINIEAWKKTCKEKAEKYQKYQEIDKKSKGISNSLEEILEKWKNPKKKKGKSVYKDGNTIIVE